MSRATGRALAVALAVGLILAGGRGAAQEERLEKLEKNLQQEKARVEQEQTALTRLSKEERRLHGEVAGLEDKIAETEAKVRRQEKELEGLKSEEVKALEEYVSLERARDQARDELVRLLETLWPVRVSVGQEVMRGVSDWPDADRRFTWLADVYALARTAQAELERRSAEMGANLSRQAELKTGVQRQLAAISQDKDKLLTDKLEFRKKLQEIRTERESREEELADILDAVTKLDLRIKSLKAKDFDQSKGSLPWPATGKVVRRFEENASPPRRGLGLALSGPIPVKAVSFGKVVHNDVLRGMGRVVILYHGKDYYSLYAFLASAKVEVGQEVDREETIGAAGYYPDAKGSGLYFELRFRQKAINPESWLAAAR